MNEKHDHDVKRLAPLSIFTIAEAAAIIGVNRRTVRTWIEDGALRAFRLGPSQKLIRIRQSDLESFIQSGEMNAS
ncbi:MAG: helix-turn-helix domain-containing protein [Anaerolineae bacterium]|nr:helix-turn-helix domain-containing protein [Anaerolineae bacterium]